MKFKDHKSEVVHLIRSKSTKSRFGDKFFKVLVMGASLYALLMVALVFYALSQGSLPILYKEGLHFIIGTDWNPVEGRESFGALPYIIGTLSVLQLQWLLLFQLV